MTTLHKHRHWSHNIKSRLSLPRMNLKNYSTDAKSYTQNREKARRANQIQKGSLKVSNGLEA